MKRINLAFSGLALSCLVFTSSAASADLRLDIRGAASFPTDESLEAIRGAPAMGGAEIDRLAEAVLSSLRKV